MPQPGIRENLLAFSDCAERDEIDSEGPDLVAIEFVGKDNGLMATRLKSQRCPESEAGFAGAANENRGKAWRIDYPSTSAARTASYCAIGVNP